MLGPVIQCDLLDILIAMRSYRYVICADIKQIYCMTSVADNDRSSNLVIKAPCSVVKYYLHLSTTTILQKSAILVSTQ